ncbi:glycosyltransferase [Myxococcota bacterium]|nr:glycosyltransferase [Myxococcota bacterium]
MPPRPVAILVRNHAPLSAVGADIEGMRLALESQGTPVRIFAGEGTAEPLAAHLPWARQQDALTLLHHTIAWPQGLAAFLRAPSPRVFRYHNVTPPRSFLPYSPAWAAGAALGRAETRLVLARGGLDLVLPCSGYSRDELRARGAPAGRTQVLAPWERPARDVVPDAATVTRLDDGATNLLFVGRMSPHKGQHHLVDALAAWRERWPEAPVRLLLVGGVDPRLAGYARDLQDRCRRLGVADHVELMGAVSQEVLEACYARATVFLLASHHEGFCVPVVEAFRRGVPVVAVSRTAVPETAGDAAVLLPDFDPQALAGAAHELAMDPARRAALVAAGRARVARYYDPADWRDRFLALIGPLLR